MKPTRVSTRTGIIILLLFVACILFLPLDELFTLAFGWIPFIAETVPNIQLDLLGLLIGLGCLLGLALGLHALLIGSQRLSARDQARPWPWRCTGRLLALIALALVAGTAAIGITHDAGWLLHAPRPLTGNRVRARTLSANNLKQMSLALLLHDKTTHLLPAGGTFESLGNGLHGWQTALLPYIEEDNLYRAIDHERAWDDPINAKAFGREVNLYVHPMAEERKVNGFALSHYASNVRVIGSDKAVSLDQLREAKGTANTILGGEVAANFKPWGHPANWRDPALGLNRSPNGFGTPMRNSGTMLMMADGSVRSFSNDADPEFLELLSEPKGKE